MNCKRGDLIACPGFTNYLAQSLKSIYCSNFAVKSLFCLGVTCMLKHLPMQKWVERMKDEQFAHMDRNQANLKFRGNIRWLPESKCYLIENGES